MSPQKHLILAIILFFAMQSNVFAAFSSYRDIPSVTAEEIAAIEALREQGTVFTYGITHTSEAFEDENGKVRGYAALLCEWLTKLFSIPFEPKLYDWDRLMVGLETGDISFTGELTQTEERLKTLRMTSAIASRSLKYFHIAHGKPLQEIAELRPVRLVFLDGVITVDLVSPHINYEFEVLRADNSKAAYNMLKNGEADAFIEENITEAAFDAFDDIVTEDFFPLIYTPVSLSTQDLTLEPVISVVQKALNSGSTNYLANLYNNGYKEYLKHKMYIMLTEEEHEYIRNNPVIPIVAEHYNYPVSFYNKYEKQWQGIFFDVIKGTEELTGLSFKLINDNKTEWPELLKLLEDGDAFMVAELIPTEERKIKGFLWPNIPTMLDKYALLSKSEFPNITLRDVFSFRVGLPSGTAYDQLFNIWFPNHTKTIEYESSDDAFAALERGEIDFVMSSQRRLLAITNHHEYPGYKANLVFNKAAESYFGFNKNHAILNSIFNKALLVIDIRSISEQWVLKTYDYKGKLAQAQRPWLIGASFLLLCVLMLVVIVFMKERGVGKVNLREAVFRAEAANHAKSTFLANMSHEIRTPMNAILSITEILIQEENVPAKIEDGLGKIYSSCTLLLGIINDILDFSKIEAGKLDIMPAEYKVASLINDSAQLNMMRIDSKPIEFKILIDENIPAKLIGDELRIKQILNNMLSNAFKYTDAGEVTLSVDFKDSNLVLSVRDTGYGMTKEQLDKLFDEYVRFQGKKSKTVEGTGLGLPITRRLIDLMGGKINVESESGKGSLFVVRLPQEVANNEVLGKDAAENLRRFKMNYISGGKINQITRDLMPYGKILVVDDVETNLYVAVGLMKLYRLQIDTAKSGRAAIDKIKNGKTYDIVFMDHMMPEMDGIETTKHLRDLGYANPIVALTANAVAGQADMFLQNGFDDFIAKPIDLRQLDSILNKLIRDKHPAEAEASLKQKETGDDAKSEEAKPADSSLHLLSKEISGLNIPEGLLRYHNDEAMYLKVLRSYTADMGSMLNSIEVISKDKLADYEIIVHSIKGASLDIFAEQTGKTAKELEMAAKSGDFNYIEAHNAQFVEIAKKLISELENVISAIDAENPKPKKDKPDIKVLFELLKACKAYDMDGADEAMDEIEKYQYTADDGLAVWLRENIYMMNFAQIIQKLSTLND